MTEEVDPFECRLNFISLLNKLNASQQSIYKVASYAMRYRRQSEDLYSCILEELEKATINARLNILYVLDSLCIASQKSHFAGYVDLVRRDLQKVIIAVVPNDAKGSVNLASTKKVLANWKQKGIFPTSDIEQAERPLTTREIKSQESSNDGFSKNDILKRMDEDRERHKRLREDVWIRPADETGDAEFEQAWSSTADLDDYDYEVMMLENFKYRPRYPWAEMLYGQEEIEIQAPPTPPPAPDLIPLVDIVKRGTDEGLGESKDDGGPDAKRAKIGAPQEGGLESRAESVMGIEKKGETDETLDMELETSVQKDSTAESTGSNPREDKDFASIPSLDIAALALSSQSNSENSTQGSDRLADAASQAIDIMQASQEAFVPDETLALESNAAVSLSKPSASSKGTSDGDTEPVSTSSIGGKTLVERDVEMGMTQDEDNHDVEMLADRVEAVVPSSESTEEVETASSTSASTVSTIIMEKVQAPEVSRREDLGELDNEHGVIVDSKLSLEDEQNNSQVSMDVEMNDEEVGQAEKIEWQEKPVEVADEEGADDEVVLVFAGGATEVPARPKSPGQASDFSTVSSLSTLSEEEPLFGEASPPSSSIASYHLTYVPREIDNGRQIFIWDLDETLIIDGTFRLKDLKTDLAEGRRLGQKMQEMIYKVADNMLFFSDLESFDNPHLLSLDDYDDHVDLSYAIRSVRFPEFVVDLPTYNFKADQMADSATKPDQHDPSTVTDGHLKQVAYRLRHVRELYDNPKIFTEKLSARDQEELEQLYADIDKYTHGWLSFASSIVETSAMRFVNQFSLYRDSHILIINILVTAGNLIPTITKCHIYRLNDLFKSDKVYSSNLYGKAWCFQQIRERYGAGNHYVVIGDGEEEEEASVSVCSSRHYTNLGHWMNGFYRNLTNFNILLLTTSLLHKPWRYR
ncbi:CTD kinase subunit gamma CTK3-domain-containing protein [Endogone sp. FLAS-F59071]|nr:CTD kinase subunit gamma CTK3-domain-containing protein [Endogone sp. FLAS-F59071]|eukprot:RUS15185.1 CTD kinase subunit gamma CTK3-domain-containing protein [Endogone sp. FLAS-F59071]